MKRLILTACTAAFLFVSCSNDKTEGESTEKKEENKSETASGEKKEQAWIPIDSAKAMQTMMEMGTPGEPHKMLAKSSGTWDAEVTMWDGIGKPPMTSKATAVTTTILGGHYQQSKMTGNMMGMPFEGISTVGYDNYTKEFVSTWVDNMSTMIMVAKGTWDDATKSINMTSKMKNPANGLDCTIREVVKIVDGNNEVMEMYGPDPKTGKEFKMMEIKYTRKK